MLKKLIFLLCLVVLASCGAKKETADKVAATTSKVTLGNENMTYKSLGNGVASIVVQFYDNNTFQFQFKSIPQPESDDKPIQISEKGYYTSKGAWKTITFQNPSLSIASLFDSNYSLGDDFKVVNEQSVAINTAKESISVWGVVCAKQ